MDDHDHRLFDSAVERALDGDSLEKLMEQHVRAARRGDDERLRLLWQLFQTAVALGNNAVVAEWSKRAKQ
jgi:hypothetical protein